MTERERVMAALNHQTTDIVPYHLDLTDDVYDRLVRELGDEHFFDKTGSHLAQERNESFTTVSEKEFRDMFGVVWCKEQKGDFGIVRDAVLKEPKFDGYVLPKPDEKLIREKCSRLQARAHQFRMYIIGFSLYERAWTLRTIPELLMDFISNRPFAEELLDRIVEYNNAVVDIVAQYDIDCVFYGDDWGQQKGLIMGPQIWRELIKPRLRRMYDHVKSKGMIVAQHSCGDIQDVFGDLIDMGMDIYNTFQPEIYDVAAMKTMYGDHVTFYGGISTQTLLPFASPQQVKSETARMMALIGRNGGYIAAPTHAIPDDVPTDNILAMLEVFKNQ